MIGDSMRLGRAIRLALGSTLTALVLACDGGNSPEKLIASAKDYLAKGDRPAAMIELKNALQAAPDNGEARFLLGKASLESRDFPAAEKELRRALELNQSADEVLPLLARAMTELDQKDALVKEFGERTLGDAQAQAAFQTLLGDAYLQRNERAAAAKAYSAALAAKADYAPARLGQVALVAVEGKLDEALARVDAILADAPKFAAAHALRADLLLAKNDKAGARKALEAAIDSDPNYLAPRLLLVNMLIDGREFDAADNQLAAARKVAPRDLRVTYLEALLAYGKGEREIARQRIQQVLKQMPDSVPSLALAGSIDLQEKRLVAAEESLRKAVARAPGHLGARQLLTLTYLRMGQPVKAKEVLQPLVEKGLPQDPRLLTLAGETYLANGDVKTASSFYQAASKAGKAPAVVARTRLGQIALAAGRVEEGFSELEAASELDPDRYQADLSIIAAHMNRKEFDKALAATKALEKKQPDKPLPFQIYGEIYLAKRDLEAARRSFDRALELQPDYLPAARRLGLLDLAAKRPADARKRYEAMIAKDSKKDQLYLALAEFEARAGADPKTVADILQRAIDANPQSTSARYALITQLLRHNERKAALAAAQSALVAIPNDPRILDVAGLAQQMAGEVNQAIETNNKWAALQPAAAAPLMRLAGLYLGQKNYDKAIEDLKRLKSLGSSARETSAMLVAAYIAANRPEEALGEARDLQRKEPKLADGYALEGEIHSQQKRLAQAEQAYRGALKLEPKADRMVMRLHRVLIESGKPSEAEAYVNKWLAENPKNATIRIYLGDTAASAGNLKAAVALYRTAVDNEPNNVVALNNLAWIGSELGDSKALGYAERAAKLAPDSAAVLDTYGTILIRQGETSKGLDYLGRASTLDPGAYAVRRLKYARELVRAGQKELAKKELDALQALPEDFPGKSDIPALLRSL
jgi:putative PEP-CTERM system TPR-repeat lipoprotein